ncbi:hypothetical protein KEH51_18095 [[Brevibacterium] frigoritolerans]|uniref:YqgU-like 6-bladed beta-propeller domain-containing protein n=1 Tax=Peribacillus frigoritolerans TaxID=450367 RepID=A0A941FKY4_9BACI|nr:hypothetical protein [Peribacillus frigoritolerans]
MNKLWKPLDFPQPFAQWASENDLMFLDWDKEEPALTALERKALHGDGADSLMLDVIHFKKMKQALMTIQVETENKIGVHMHFMIQQTSRSTLFRATIEKLFRLGHSIL